MEKKDLLGVRKKLPPAKRPRRKMATPAPAVGGALVKAIVDYLASDSYMYAPLASAPPPPPPPPPPQPKAAPSAAVPSAPPGSLLLNSRVRSNFLPHVMSALQITRCVRGAVLG